MKKAFKHKAKRSTYRIWILSYLFVLLIPMIFGVSIYVFAMKTVRQQAEMAQRETLRSVVEQTDRTLQQLQESVMAVLSTSTVDNVGKHKGEFDHSQYEMMAVVQENINKIKTNSSYIDEIYLYFPTKEYMLTSYTYLQGEQSLFTEDIGISQEEFQKLVSEPSYKRLHISQANRNPKLLLVNSEISAMSRSSAPKSVMIVSLNVNALTEMLKLESSTNWIMDENGEIMAAGRGELTEELREAMTEAREQEGFWELGDSHVRSLASKYFDLMYVNVQPREAYYSRMDQMNRVLAIYLLICLAGGGILAVMLARKQYRPVEEILESLKKIKLTDTAKGDMEQIKTSIDHLQSEKEQFRQRLESQKRAMRSTVMYNLIKGRHVDRYVLEGIPYVKNGFQYDGGFLMGFDVEDASRAFFEEHEDLDDDLLDLVFYVVENIAEELLSEKYSAFVCEADGILLCLVNGEQDCQEVLEDLRDVAGQIVQFLEEKFAVKLSAGISNYHENWTGIEQCYHDIQDIMDYRSVNGVEEPVLLYGALETFWLQQEGSPAAPSQETSGASTEQQDKPANASEEAFAAVETKISTSEIADMVVAYIHTNYRDQDLSVGKIADEFGISLSYLSQIFKRTMKTGLLEYIHLQRIEEAKKLLLEGMSVQSVAETVGYYNTRPLIRMFKRIENMTPTEYKESKKED